MSKDSLLPFPGNSLHCFLSKIHSFPQIRAHPHYQVTFVPPCTCIHAYQSIYTLRYFSRILKTKAGKIVSKKGHSRYRKSMYVCDNARDLRI